MSQSPFEEFDELMCEFRFIRHILDHDVFIEDSVVRSSHIFIDGFHQLIKWKGFSDWHDFISEFLIGRMQRDCEFYIDFVFDKFFDPWDDPAGRDCDMSPAQRKSILLEHDFKGFSHVIVIEERFPHSHKYDISDCSIGSVFLFSKSFFDIGVSKKNLRDDLFSCQILFEAEFSCYAKDALHCTSYL